MKRYLLVAAVVAAVMVGIGYAAWKNAQAPMPEEKIKIGYMAPLSGADASYGIGIRKAIEIAIEDLGLAGRIELLSRDTGCDAEKGQEGIRELINAGVVAVIGEICSGATLAAAPDANAHEVVLMSPASTNPDITDAGEYIFRTVPSDTLQGDFLAQLVWSRGFRRAAVVFSDEAYGEGLSGVFRERFAAAGGEVVAMERFTLGDIQMRELLSRVRSQDPDAIVIVSNSIASAAAILLQAKELGMNAAFFASESVKDQSLLDDAGVAAEGLTLTAVSAGSPHFIDAYRSRYGIEPIQFAAQGYDAFFAIGTAIKGGAKTGAEIRDALASLAFDGVSGPIDFDDNGDVAGNYDVYEVRGGTFVLVK